MGTSLEDSDSPSTGIWFDGGRAENGEGTGQRYHALSPSFFYYASPIGQHKAELGIDAEAGLPRQVGNERKLLGGFSRRVGRRHRRTSHIPRVSHKL